MEYKLTYNQFEEGLKQGKLLGLKCNQCGAYTVPPKKVCYQCTSEDMDIAELSGKGKIQSFTTIYVPPAGFQAAYTVVLVELDEGPWVMGNLSGIEPEKTSLDLIGRRVNTGYKIVPRDTYFPRERVALVFSLQD